MVGDIGYIRTLALKHPSSLSYINGARPRLPKSLRAVSPTIAALIEEMWLDDFRARPAMKDVVVRLKACVFIEGVSNGEDQQDDEGTIGAFHMDEHGNPQLEEELRLARLEILEQQVKIEKLQDKNKKLETKS